MECESKTKYIINDSPTKFESVRCRHVGVVEINKKAKSFCSILDILLCI